MAFDQDLAASVRTALVDASAIREVKMFGGIGFMLNGKLVAATSKRGLLVRVGKDHRGNALAQQGARPMVMRGRTMEGYCLRMARFRNYAMLQNYFHDQIEPY